MNKNNFNFIFFGTPDMAKETLEILKASGYIPSLIITTPDKPKGRKMILTPPPVKTWAIENKIDYIQPENLKGENVIFRNITQRDGASIAIREHADMRVEKNNILPDLNIVVAYGKILPEEIINSPKLGSINIHYSLLPKYRGASPVESVILNNEKETGITIQKMAYKLDSGPIIAQENTEIKNDEKAEDLKRRLVKIGGDLLVKTLPRYLSEEIKLIEQNEKEATYCKKIKKEDGLIDLENEEPTALYNKFRAYALWPRIFFFKNEKRIIITDAGLENGQFMIKKVLPEGKKEIKYEDFLRNQ